MRYPNPNAHGSQRIPGHDNALHVANSATPSIADGRLYIRLDDGLACLDLRKAPTPLVTDSQQTAHDPVAVELAGLIGLAHASERAAAVNNAQAAQAKNWVHSQPKVVAALTLPVAPLKL